jgi:hypothetical protein
VPARLRLILIWVARFRPTDFLVVGSMRVRVFLRRGFPTDFPVVGWAWADSISATAVASLPISPW